MQRIPSWAKHFADQVRDGFTDNNGHLATFDYWYYGPGTQVHDAHLLVFAPHALNNLGNAIDRATVAGPATVDIRAVQMVFERLESTSYHAATGETGILRRHLVVTGRIDQLSVTVYIYDEPLDDDRGCMTTSELREMIQ